MTATELGTRIHEEIERQRKLWGTADEAKDSITPVVGDCHIAQGVEEINRQLMAYASLGTVPVMIVNGGDLLHDETLGPDIVMVIDDAIYHLDYKTCEERVLQHMDSISLAGKYLLDKVAEPKVVKPTRGRSKDWEQRNRKRRR